MLAVQGVSLSRGGRQVLKDVSVVLQAGEVVAICGPNGAGKTSLLKILSGELAPSRGLALLDRRPICEMQPRELAARRAVVPQATVLSFPFTAREVVRLGATVPGFANAGPAAARAIGRAGLHGLEDRLYVELSGGERQRVHFARALCQLDAARTTTAGSRALLLDEPTANLDLAHQVLLLQQSQDEARSGQLVVAVLHDLNLAARWADRIVLMTAGQIVGQGAPRDIIRDDLLAHAYGCTIRANCTPSHGMPFVLPQLLELDR